MPVYDDQRADEDQETLAGLEDSFFGPAATESGSQKLAEREAAGAEPTTENGSGTQNDRLGKGFTGQKKG